MRCISPIQLPVRIGGKKYNNYFLCPCGKCEACLETKRHAWIPRLLIESKVSPFNYFLTLTYDNDHMVFNKNNLWCVDNRHLTLFLKRLRHTVKEPFRYFAVSEYGHKTGRPHFHIILFNYQPLKGDYFDNLFDTPLWSYGYTDVHVLCGELITYCTKYILKDAYDDQTDLDKSIMRCSKGIGESYLTPDVIAYHRKTLDTTIVVNGFRYPMHRYYRNKIFDEQTRQELFQNYLDQQKYYDFVADDPYYFDRVNGIRNRVKSILNKDKL